MTTRALAIALGLVLSVSSSEGRTLADRLGADLAALSEGFARAVGQSLPLVSASPGVAFEFDPESGGFTRVRSTFSQLFVERASPLGRGHWTTSLVYQHVAINRFEGHDLARLHDPNPVVAPDGTPLFVHERADIAIAADQVTANVTYGLTDTLDVNLAVPVVVSSLDREDRVRLVAPGSSPTSLTTGTAATKAGVGDVYVRAKQRLVARTHWSLAAGLALRLPTADTENFHGVGSTGVAPSLIASSAPWSVGKRTTLQIHANAAFDVDAEDTGQSQGRWAFGLDGAMGEHLRTSVAILGRHAIADLPQSDELLETYCIDRTSSCTANPATSRTARRSAFGFQGKRADHLDLSIGTRVVVWRDTIVLFASVLVPLLDEGVRTDPIPVAGIEAAF